MSRDPRLNGALFNFCMTADDGPRAPPDPNRARASVEDLRWLRTAMEAMEMPDRTVKRCLTRITDWFLPAMNAFTRATPTGAAAASSSASQTPVLLLAGPGPHSTGVASSKKRSDDDGSSSGSGTSGALATKARTSHDEQHENVTITYELLPDVTDEIADAADELCEILEDMNYAKEFMLMRGIKVYLDVLRLSFEAVVNGAATMTTAAAAEAFRSAKAKRWSQLRTVLLRSLGAASANFDEFQSAMCKLDYASAVTPPLSDASRAVTTYFPAELAAALFCVTNTVSQHAEALRLFLVDGSGMYHLANVVETLNSDSSNSNSDSPTGAADVAARLNAKRRAFNLVRFLVEEAGVTSPRILRAAIDTASTISRGAYAKRGIELQRQQQQRQMQDADAAAGASAAADAPLDAEVQNACAAGAFAARTIACALARVMQRDDASNKTPVDTTSTAAASTPLEANMPQWGAHLVERFGGQWWAAFRAHRDTAARFVAAEAVAAGSGADLALPPIVTNVELNEAVMALIVQLGRLKGAFE